MIPTRYLAETRTPDGSRFSLHEHDGHYFLKLNSRQLMGSNFTVSENMLAEVACAAIRHCEGPRILIGGLGLGFSLRRALELGGSKACVQVAELLPEVVGWNREFLAGLNGGLLDDPRVEIFVGDVFDCIIRGPGRFDAILLDVDNGPTALVQPGNSRLYDRKGIERIHRALRPGGCVAFWSAEREPAFVIQLTRGGFLVEEFEAKAHERAKRAAHRIYLAKKQCSVSR